MKKVLRVLQGETETPPPIWLMRQAGRYLPEYRETRKQAGGFMDLCFSPKFAAEVTLQPIRRFGFDASIIFSDILTIPHALGQAVRFEEGIGPILAEVSWGKFLAEAETKDVTESLKPVYEAIQLVKQGLPEETTLIGFAGSPWTVATYMVGGGKSKDFGEILAWVNNSGSPLDDLICVLVNKTICHLSQQIQAGAEVIQLFDTWASVVPSQHRDRLILTPLKSIVSGLRDLHPDIPIIYFAKGLYLQQDCHPQKILDLSYASV